MASTYLKKTLELQEQVFAATVNANVNRIETEYTERANLAKIDAQQRAMESQATALANQQVINGLTGLTGLLTLAMAVMLFIANRKKRKMNFLLDQKVKERTTELENSRIAMEHAHREKLISIEKLTTEVNSAVATLVGLTNLAGLESTDQQEFILKEIKLTALDLGRQVRQYSTGESEY